MCSRMGGRNAGAENLLPLSKKFSIPALNIYNTYSSAGFVFMPSST